MRLGSKIFLTSALVIVVLAGVGFLSLRALGRLVSVNREIATRTVPALRLTASAREAIAPLVRLEARAIVLGDARYATAWTERAARVADNLDRLAEYAVSEREAFYLREASAAFEGYRRVVAEEQALLQRGERARALRLTDADARVLTEDVQENLDGLMAATHTRVLAAQAEAARLESRTWTAGLHELRPPLTSIRGAADLLRDGVPGPLTEKQERLMDIIGQSSERLLRLVNQILETSRLRAGLVELDRKPLNLAWLVDRVVEEIHPQAEEAGITLERERLGADFTYRGDEERLHQLVVNLGANAIRFTPRGGRVVVRLIDTGPELELQVEDTGVGIPADALPHIF